MEEATGGGEGGRYRRVSTRGGMKTPDPDLGKVRVSVESDVKDDDSRRFVVEQAEQCTS